MSNEDTGWPFGYSCARASFWIPSTSTSTSTSTTMKTRPRSPTSVTSPPDGCDGDEKKVTTPPRKTVSIWNHKWGHQIVIPDRNGSTVLCASMEDCSAIVSDRDGAYPNANFDLIAEQTERWAGTPYVSLRVGGTTDRYLTSDLRGEGPGPRIALEAALLETNWLLPELVPLILAYAFPTDSATATATATCAGATADSSGQPSGDSNYYLTSQPTPVHAGGEPTALQVFCLLDVDGSGQNYALVSYWGSVLQCQAPRLDSVGQTAGGRYREGGQWSVFVRDDDDNDGELGQHEEDSRPVEDPLLESLGLL